MIKVLILIAISLNLPAYSSSSNWFTYLNTIRSHSGMTSFKYNSILSSSSLNHSKYIDATDEFDHIQTRTNSTLYTGKTPSDRAKAVGYAHTTVGENISKSSNEKESIDNLFTAIYHRMGFLSFKYDEIGAGEYNGYYTYNMGLDKLSSLCSNNFTASGAYYSFCNNENRTSKEEYENAFKIQYASNPDMVVFPYEGATDIPPVFYEEKPDPLPSASMSANPISVHFNPNVNGTVTALSVSKRGASAIVSNATANSAVFMDKDNDPNSKFSDNDYALFPLARFDWGATYDVRLSYTIDGLRKSKEYSFTTATLANLHTITENTQNIEVTSGEPFHIYFKLNNGTTKLSGGLSYNYNTEAPIVTGIDTNTYSMTLTGNSGDIVNVDYNGGSFKITLQSYNATSTISNQ